MNYLPLQGLGDMDALNNWALVGPFYNPEDHGSDANCPAPDRLFRFCECNGTPGSPYQPLRWNGKEYEPDPVALAVSKRYKETGEWS